MSEGKRLTAGVSLVSGATLASGLLNIALLMSLTRLLSKAEFGVISFSYMLFGLISVVGALGLPSALLFYTARLSGSQHRALARHVTLLLLALGALLGCGLWLGGPHLLSEAQQESVGPLLPIIALALVGDLPGQTLPSYLLALERFGLSALATLGFSITRFVGLVLPATLGLGVEAMAWGLSAAALLRGGLMLGYALWPHAQRSHEQVETQEEMTQEEVTQEEVTWSTRELLAYGLPLSMSAIIGKLNVQADKYLIAALTTAEVYAIYHVGAIELPLVYGVAYSVTNALTPHLITRYHEGDREGFLTLWHTSVHKVASLIMPVAFYLMCFATEVISLAFSERYIGAALPFRVYLLLLPLRLCSYGAVVRATGATRPVFTATLLSLVSNLLLNYPLYQLLGVAGPALSSVIAQLVAITLLLKTLKGRLEVGWGEVFPFKRLIALLLTSALTALVGWALASSALSALSVQSHALALTLGALLQLPLYFWLGLKSSLLSKEDLSFVYGALTLKRARAALKRRLG